MPKSSPPKASTDSPVSISQAAPRTAARRRRKRLDALSVRFERINQHCEGLKRQVAQLTNQLAWANSQLAQQQPCTGTSDEWQRDQALPGHQYGVQMIALSIELAKRIGFRATEFALQVVFDALGLKLKVPSHDAIEHWMLRIGVAELNDETLKGKRMIWLSDHSSQIGKEKILVIIGVPIEALPPAGQSLDLKHVHVLSVVPGESWKKEDVEREYRKLAERIGAPVYLLCDGAIELREPAQRLEENGQNTVVLSDLKHHAANLLEKLVGRTERFQSFHSQVGLTRNRVQQTELSHFAPPPPKQKSRFMNLASLFRWSQMVLLQLEDSDSPSRDGISEERMEEKLGWLREFAHDLSCWNECQQVINIALAVINTQGLSKHSLGKLEDELKYWLGEKAGPTDESSQERPAHCLSRSLHTFVADSVARLRSDAPRAGLSTEILESLLGRFKQVTGQHSRGGFTRLIAAIPALCRRVDAALVRRRFKTTKARDVKTWLRTALGTTLTARRNAAYAHYTRCLASST